MRSDFIGDCALYYRLPEAVSEAQFLVPSLTRGQREDVIRQPIAKAGAEIEPSLVQTLLNEAGTEIDQLPVLQHCLARLWDRAKSRATEQRPALNISDYETVGRLQDALSQHANEIMASLPGLEQVVESVFRALSEVDKEGRATRRAIPFEQLLAETGASRADLIRVLDRFRADDCSFIVPSTSAVPVLHDATQIDVGHEALLRRWDRMTGDDTARGWLSAEDDDAGWYRMLLRFAKGA